MTAPPHTPPNPNANPRSFNNSNKEYRLSGLDCGKSYDFTIEGYYDDRRRHQPWTYPSTTRASTAPCEGDDPPVLSDPPAPAWFRSKVSSFASTETMRFSWPSASGIDNYRVEYRAVGETDWATFTETGFPNTFAYSDEDDALKVLDCETLYEFRLRAHGDGTTFNAVWSTPLASSSQVYSPDCPSAAGVPATPTGFTSTTTRGVYSATLSWDDPQDDSITKYQYRLDGFDENGGIKGKWTNIPDSGAGTTSYTITAPQTDRPSRYEGFLRAVNGHGAGSPTSLRWVDIGW